MAQIPSLTQFYTCMESTRKARLQLASQYLNAEKWSVQLIDLLKESLAFLESIHRSESAYIMKIYDNKTIKMDISYELNELKKDLFFLSHSEEAFFSYLASLHPSLEQEVTDGLSFLKGIFLKTFIADRDGTINNYCGRYRTSIQSLYNAVFLSQFAQRCVKNAVILTSAPLADIGLVDITTTPEGIFIYAGSKGREFLDKNGHKTTFPVKQYKQKKLDQLNKELVSLLKQPEYEMYELIGSGLQFKFGQTTIARQDIYGSIPEEESYQFLQTIKEIVKSIDTDGIYFRIEDTGKDIEIILTIDDTAEKGYIKDFDKGDGICFIDTSLNLGLDSGTTLVCGDTSSDIPMLKAVNKRSGSVLSLFVTKNQQLRNMVSAECPHAFFISEPDSLVVLLYKLARREK